MLKSVIGEIKSIIENFKDLLYLLFFILIIMVLALMVLILHYSFGVI